MKVRLTRRALRQLDQARDYIASDNPAAARRMVERLSAAIGRLEDHPELGRPGRLSGTRELVVSGTPFIVPYRIGRTTIDVLAIMHSARAGPSSGF